MIRSDVEYLAKIAQQYNLKSIKFTEMTIEIEAYPKPMEFPEALKQAVKQPLTDDEMLDDPFQGLPR